MAKSKLDDLQAMRKLDPEGMLDRIAEMSAQCRAAWQRLSTFRLPDAHRAARSVVMAGLGGSAIGADLARALVVDEARIPIFVHRDYGLPAFAGPDTLVIACSYSGGTEETLSAFEEGQRRGCPLLALTPGGELGARARSIGAPVLDYQYRSQPRAAMGYSLVLLLGVLAQMGQGRLDGADVEAACRVLDAMQDEVGPAVPAGRNPAKQLALTLDGKLPVVYGTGILSDVARRYKTQFNENSKAWSFFEVLPELNHNSVVGYQLPEAFTREFVVVFLTSSFNNARNLQRMAIVRDLLSQRGIGYHTVEAGGDSPLAHVLSTVHFGDYSSYYMAILNGVDPTPVDVITYLKNRLADRD
ncbi:MAG: bifunctional phosphoglucose/phosphomannose isomerase [Chloroflexi bacterium]|nr:bifunctional phosphoglucose/phosphomannose isomerase [Chloroflexota bacterium]